MYDHLTTPYDGRQFGFLGGGGGGEYTHGSGLSLWAELALCYVRRERLTATGGFDSTFGVYGSAGVGYRFGR